MLLNYFCLILLQFLTFSYAEKISLNSDNSEIIINASETNGRRIKKYVVDLSIYSNMTEYKTTEKRQENIANVCKFSRQQCSCIDNQVTCIKNGFKHLNVKASKENFDAKRIFIVRCSIDTLEKVSFSFFNNEAAAQISQLWTNFPQDEKIIEHLMMDWTQIRQIRPEAFDNLTSLRILEFRSTRLAKLNEDLLTPQLGKTLVKFTYSSNYFLSFNPSGFKYMFNLGELSFLWCDFGGKIENQFPESLSKLKFLNLKGCKLIFLGSHVFDNLRSLEYLKLDRNNFTSIPAAINSLPNLRMFSFGENIIESFKKNSFEGNPKLESLYLVNSTYLKTVEDCAFCNLPNLKQVDFYSCNKLTHIHENAFGAVSNGFSPEITKFTIESCNISILPEKLLDWKNVKYLAINYNPFICNCSMAWLFTDLLSDDPVYENRLTNKKNDFYIHHKYTMGCLNNHLLSSQKNETRSIKDIFASCPTSSNGGSLTFLLIVLLIVVVCFVVCISIYANRVYLIDCYR